jgi:hypothetical protein
LSSGLKAFALKFISGKYQGGEFPLKPEKQVVIGRSSELDMVLVEDMVSRKHAKITCSAGKIIIEDLGSTNGTFVNGEKIKQTRIKEGDRILIGTSILKVVAQGSTAAPMDEAQVKQKLEEAAVLAAARQTKSSSSMTGKLEEVPLPDLLQLFQTSKKNGVLLIKGEREARIYMRQGKIYYAVIDKNHDIGPQKSFFRIVSWEKGDFELLAPDGQDFMIELEDPTEVLLMEGLRQLDEIRHLQKNLPPVSASLSLSMPLTAPLRELKPDQLDLLQLVYNYGAMQTILDKADGTDLETATSLLELVRKSYVKAADQA